MAESRDVPFKASQASYFARPTMSNMPGRLPVASPATACLYNAYSFNIVSLSGRAGKFMASRAAVSNRVCSDSIGFSPEKWLGGTDPLLPSSIPDISATAGADLFPALQLFNGMSLERIVGIEVVVGRAR